MSIILKIFFRTISCVICLSIANTTFSATTLKPAPKNILNIFNANPNQTLSIKTFDPGEKYQFETSEKDTLYAKDKKDIRFNTVEISLHPLMKPGTVMANIHFIDKIENRVEVNSVNLLKLIPTLDAKNAMQLPEYLLAEYNRFGVIFRREHNEFTVKAKTNTLAQKDKNIYRLGLWNNCLSQTRWEMTLHTEDYSDFEQRSQSPLNLNQKRTLAHVWFYVDNALYTALLKLKNPHLSFSPDISYEALIEQGKKVPIDLSTLRTLKHPVLRKIEEIGHKTKRPLVALDMEQYYKWQYNLLINKNDFTTYDDILNVPIKLAKFESRGIYQTKKPKVFDFGWMRQLNDIHIHTVDVPGSDTYVQITLTGKHAPFNIVMGNIDLSAIDEQKLAGYLFGINTYPKSRRHNPPPDTIRYDADSIPQHLKPYQFLINKNNQLWGDNHEMGLEKIYLSWESIDKNILEIYVLSYERITPVWMARVRLDDVLVDRIRRKRALYASQ